MLFSPIEEIIEDINFMATHGRGLICLPMRAEMLDGLQIQGAQRKDDDRCSYHRV